MSNKTALTILVVDDEANLRELLYEVLSDGGHQVATAASAEEALALFDQHQHPLIITDIRMPGMNGMDLLKQIKQKNADTQVIMMADQTSLHSTVAALRAGAADYLIKPFDQIEVVHYVINRTIEKILLLRDNKQLMTRLNKRNSDLDRINHIIQELALKDGLTGLYNHRYFHEALAAEHARATRYQREYSLLLIDIDRFKTYNDTHGHPQGDELLKTLAEIMGKRLRQSDSAARYGGEEFALILPETNRKQAVAMGHQLREFVAEYPFSGRECQPHGKITVSIGLATFPHDGEEPRILIDKADQSLHRAKRGGRNTVLHPDSEG